MPYTFFIYFIYAMGKLNKIGVIILISQMRKWIKADKKLKSLREGLTELGLRSRSACLQSPGSYSNLSPHSGFILYRCHLEILNNF